MLGQQVGLGLTTCAKCGSPTCSSLTKKSQSPSKLVFLDIDGVLNTQNSPHTDSLEPHLVANLGELLKKTNAQVVLCSTWRLYPKLRSMFATTLSLEGCPQSGALEQTPLLDEWTRSPKARQKCCCVEMHQRQRCNEIITYLRCTQYKGNWIVIDDMDLSGNEDIAPRQIRPNTEVGFDRDCLEKAFGLIGVHNRAKSM
eukprot:c11394_g1_i1.p1 GENE.c11394_g1_i1~~c11394_g1_i1.p1  ORF type:complete len:199 (-),score=24.08 c11394_g1_i1:226-822(-)